MCQLWEFIPGTFIITRLEVDPNNIQTVVVCCYEGEKVCLFTSKLIQFCIDNNIESIRFHTRLKKLGKVMEHKYLFKKIAELANESVYQLRV